MTMASWPMLETKTVIADAMDAIDAIDAMDAMDATDATDAIDAIDAIDATVSLSIQPRPVNVGHCLSFLGRYEYLLYN